MIFTSLTAFLIGFYFGIEKFWEKPPRAHEFIVENTTIIDLEANFPLTPVFSIAKKASWSKGLPLSAVFTPLREYYQSTWLWQRYDDTEWVMTIWGPSDDGITYLVEFGRVAANPFRITCAGQTIELESVTWKWAEEGSMIGYVAFEVQVV